MAEIERSLLEKFKCSLCAGYLSTSPVILTTNSESICGNCSTKNKIPLGTRNKVYEYLALLIKFPCRYEKNGCKEKLDFVNVADHEFSCCFRLYECPLKVTSKCVWEGISGDIKQHFEEIHKELIAEHPYKFNPIISSSNKNCVLVQVLDSLFLIQLKCHVIAAKIWFCVQFIGNPMYASLFAYKIKIGNGGNTITKRSDVKTIESLISGNNDVDVDYDVDIDINSLLKIIKDIKTVTCSIKISLKYKNCMNCSLDYTKDKIILLKNGYYCSNCASEVNI